MKKVLILNIYVKTSSKYNKITIINNIINIYITAIPINNKANKYLIKFLSKKFKTPQKNIIIQHGKFSNNKLIKIYYPKVIPKEINNF